ncbi:MAG: hypothetical protein WCT16_00580 [Candidatus Buchananbacteria bacterium]
MITTMDQVRLIKWYIFRIRQLFVAGQLIEKKDAVQQYTSEAFIIINQLEDMLGRSSDGKIACSECFLTYEEHTSENFSNWLKFIQPFIDALIPILEEQKN